MTAHLLNFGHRKIGMLLGVEGHTATEQRFQGFTDELTQQGLEVDRALVLPGEFAFDAGEIAAEKMLTGPNPPTAIFACNDDMALAVLAVAQRLGIRVPQDLSVTGFDDTPMSHMTWPQITTVRQPVREIGRVAADLIITHSPRRNGWPDPMPNRLMDLELVIRQSSGPVASKKG
jgi:LacI family transcriptional regulator